MSNHLKHILAHWFPLKDEYKWVLATIFDTEGSSYRKKGAHMLINDLGRYYGLLSGGCLESDIMNQARRCWDNNENRIVTYDMREEEDLAWQLGIGCGGMVKILLQPVDKKNQYLYLHHLYQAVCDGQFAEYRQRIEEGPPKNLFAVASQKVRKQPEFVLNDGGNELIQTIAPPFHIAVFGGGSDAQPVVNIAGQLGWTITLLDSRSAYARNDYFPCANSIIKTPLSELNSTEVVPKWINTIDAAVVMGHSITMDAEALKLVATSSAKYLGVLGPIHRTDRLFEKAELEKQHYPIPIANPVGLRLGGELPESIALSIISEIHCYLENSDGLSISGVFHQ